MGEGSEDWVGANLDGDNVIQRQTGGKMAAKSNVSLIMGENKNNNVHGVTMHMPITEQGR